MNAAFFRVSFLTNAAFEHLRMRRLLKGGVYFTLSFPNAAFIGGRRLKEEIQYFSSPDLISGFTVESKSKFFR